MPAIFQELRQSVRRMIRTPSLAVAAILCTALGVGAVSAAWSTVDAVLLRPLPYPNPDQLAMLWETGFGGSDAPVVVSSANYADWRERNQTFERMAAFNVWFPGLIGTDRPEKLLGAMVTADFFPILGVKPLLGRTITPEDDRPGAGPVVVLSYALWQRRFGGDPKIVGQSINLDGVPYTVVGVLPADFRQPEPAFVQDTTALWRPLALDPAQLQRGPRFLRVIGRLKPGVPLARAQADMKSVSQRMAKEFPEEDEGMSNAVVSLREQLVGEVRRPLLLLLAAAGLVLLVACANMASLLLAGAAGRVRETALRSAIGAGRWDLARQALAESLPPALAGGVLGFLAGVWGARILLAAGPPLARPAEVGFDVRGLLFALAVCLVAALLAGLAPASSVARADPAGVLQEGGARSAGPGGPRGARVLSFLIALEVALSLPLLIGAGLLGRSLSSLANTPLGFSSHGVATMRLDLPPARYAGQEEVRVFYDRLLTRVSGVPGVRAAGLTTSLPLSTLFDISRTVFLEGVEQPITSGYRAVTPGYFAALSIPLKAGRLLSATDRADGVKVALVNETFVRTAWQGQPAVGKKLALGTLQGGTEELEVVGVVGDVRHTGPSDEPRAEMFVPYTQNPLRFATLVTRVDGSPAAAIGPLRSAVWEVDRDLALTAEQPMDKVMESALARPRFHRLLAGVLAGVALALAAAGLFGVTVWSVARRTREIGLRMALGADRNGVIRRILRVALVPVVAGLILGLVASFILTRLLTGLLHGVEATDPITFVAAPLVLLLVAAAAAILPARRAAKTDPAIALRIE